MRGPPSEYAAPPIYLYPAQRKPGVRFSRTELIQLGAAILALSVAFTILYVRLYTANFVETPGLFLAIFFPASLLAVGSGVGVHEIMHKVVAQRYGHWAEFRYNPQGLAFALIFAAAIGFLYGAPGATWISGAVTREQNGRISAAGPVSNMVICVVLMAIFVAIRPSPNSFGGLLLVLFILQAAGVNAILAGFNLLPIMPLDGAKVWAWSKGVYAALAAMAIALIVLSSGVLG